MTASRDAARNLLLGILSLQNNFVSRDVLLAAFAAWTADKSRSFGELLVFAGGLSPAHLELLEALVEAHLERHEGSPEKSLAAVTSIQPVPEELADLNDSDLAASLRHVSARPQGQPDPYLTEPFTPTAKNDGLRFRFLRPHAEGGLGKVSVASDEELHREVALKEIKAKYADDPESRSRFLREAEITGGLEHPGIVPVYGLGQYADGRPFYACTYLPRSGWRPFRPAGERSPPNSIPTSCGSTIVGWWRCGWRPRPASPSPTPEPSSRPQSRCWNRTAGSRQGPTSRLAR